MPIVNQNTSAQTEWANCPEGDYQAVVADVIDLGWIEKTYEGVSQGLKPHVQLVYQIGGTDDNNEPVAREDGKPWLVFGRKLMLSLDNRAAFYKEVAGILGKKTLDEILEMGPFDTDILLGKNINALVSHVIIKANKPGQTDKTFVNIQPVKPWPAKHGPEIKVRDYTERHKSDKWDPPIHSAFGPKPDEDAGGVAPAPKPTHRSEPTPPVIPTEGELLITATQLARIPSIARQKFGDNYGGDLAEFVFDGYGKKQKFLSKDEGDDLIARLLKLADFEEDSDPFEDSDDEATEEEARALLSTEPVKAPAPKGNGKAAAEAYATA